MGTIKKPERVKLIVGIITEFPELVEPLKKSLHRRFGPVDLESELIPFDFTSYYEEEMGRNLQRKFLSFQKLILPSQLAAIKRWTNALEQKYARSRHFVVARPINLDPGYLTSSKLILASTKDYAHRIYLQNGIYAEVTLIYKNDHFQPLEWTYPDYQTESYLRFFNQARETHKEQRRNPHPRSSPRL